MEKKSIEDAKDVPAPEPKVSLKLKQGDYQVHIYLQETRGLVPENEG